MIRWRWIAAIAIGTLLGIYVGAWADTRGFSVRGVMSATDQEAQEGYFAIGREFVIVTTPGSPIQDDLKAMVGGNVVVVVEAR